MRQTTLWTRVHPGVSWTAIASLNTDRDRLRYNAGAHPSGFSGNHWGRQSETLENAKALADAAVPAHDCSDCPDWQATIQSG